MNKALSYLLLFLLHLLVPAVASAGGARTAFPVLETDGKEISRTETGGVDFTGSGEEGKNISRTGAKRKSWIGKDFVLSGTPFLNSQNPAGLSSMDFPNLSEATVRGGKMNGGLVNYHESDDAFNIGIGASSLYRLNEKIVMRGAISFEHLQGRNMSGSVLTVPYDNPFDICEFDDSDKGTKKLERYHVQTEISYQVIRGLSLGGSMDFTAANYAKMKDLRHANDWSDLKIGLGTVYRFSPIISIGIAWNFRKSIEGISFERFSPGELNYELLISYGSFWGKRKSFEETSGQISKSKQPIHNAYNGFSLQIDLHPTRQSVLFIEGGWSHHRCDYGHKSPNSILYNEFKGNLYNIGMTGIVKTTGSRHLIRISMEGKPTDAYESIYKTVNEAAGTVNTVYYDPKKLGHTDVRKYSLSYRADWNRSRSGQTGSGPTDNGNEQAGNGPDDSGRTDNGQNDNGPTVSGRKNWLQADWTLEAGFTVNDRQSLITIYPYYRQERLVPFSLQLKATGNRIIRNSNLLTFGLDIGYIDSFKAEVTDGSYIPDATQVRPKTSPIMMGREQEYLCSSQLYLNPDFRYSRQFKTLTAFIDLNYSWRHSLEPLQFLTGNQRHEVSLTLGLTF